MNEHDTDAVEASLDVNPSQEEPQEAPDERLMPEASLDLNDRLLLALRQSAMIGVALLITGLVAERLRPDAMLDRGMASTAFLWAAVLWCVLFILHAIAFSRSQIKSLDGAPLLGALAVGGAVFAIGSFSLEGAEIARTVIYLFANGVGAAMFWWALFGIVALLIARLNAPADND